MLIQIISKSNDKEAVEAHGGKAKYTAQIELNLLVRTRKQSCTKLRLSSKYSGSDSGTEALTRLAREVAFFDSCCFSCAVSASFAWLAFLFAPFLIAILSSQRQREKNLWRDSEIGFGAWFQSGGSGI
jgi:hypothetical protein